MYLPLHAAPHRDGWALAPRAGGPARPPRLRRRCAPADPAAARPARYNGDGIWVRDACICIYDHINLETTFLRCWKKA